MIGISCSLFLGFAYVFGNHMLANLRVTGGIIKTDSWNSFIKFLIHWVCFWYQTLRIFTFNNSLGDVYAVGVGHRYKPLIFSILLEMYFPPSLQSPNSLLHLFQFQQGCIIESFPDPKHNY